MKRRPFLPSLLILALAFPAPAWAEEPADAEPPASSAPLPAKPPVQPVQPVPYVPAQPVPYIGTTDPSDSGGMNVPHAGAVGNDFVYLKGGGLIRGTLIEAIPNDHATVELATGQSAVIPWDRVQRIERGVSPAPSPSPGPPPRIAPLVAEQPSAFVHIEADSLVTLERRDPGGRWMLACTSPCDEELPLKSSYRISGAGVRTSNDFRLNARPGDHVVLELSAASKGAFAGGIVLTSVGGFSLLLGSMVSLAAAAADSDPYEHHDGTASTVGLVMVVGGAAAALVGILLTVRNRHSNVAQSIPGSEPRDDAWLRAPQWHEDKTGSAAGLPKAVGVPLLQLKF